MTPAPLAPTATETLRRRSYDVRRLTEVIQTLTELSRSRHSGPVTIHFAQGGVRGLVAEERAPEPEKP